MRKLMMLVVLVAFLGGTGRVVEGKDTRPNILFIMSDDHAYQAIGAYGSKMNKTPNLDRIAKEGMKFEYCFVTNSICGPCRAVILTGKYSHLNGFFRNGNRFDGSQQTVAKILQKNGYQTAVVGKWHLSSDPTGFDYWKVLIGQGPYYNPPLKTKDGIERNVGYTTEVITDKALDFLKNHRDPKKPFFMMYQHKAPHRAWEPGPKYLNNYDDVEIPEPKTLFDDYSYRASGARNQTMTLARHFSKRDQKLVPPRNLTKEQKEAWDKAYGPKNKKFLDAKLTGKALTKWNYQRYIKDYLRCIDAVDFEVGRVLDYLDKTGLAKNTVVIYSSDQGFYLGEHGWYDKRWMYEESFRTPLLVRWPGAITPGKVNTDMTMNLDFAQTFLDIAGIKQPEDMQGASIVPLMKGKAPKDWRKSVYYQYYEFPGAHSVAKHYGVRTERYKLIHYHDLGEWELFDLKEDPNEMKSVHGSPKYVEITKDLEKELKRLRKKYKADHDDHQAAYRRRNIGKVPVGLAVHFEADSLKPRRVWDKSGKRNHAAMSGKVGTGKEDGKAVMVFDGKSALTVAKPGRRLDPSVRPLIVGAHVKAKGLDGVIVAHGGASHGYSLYLKGGKVRFAVRGSDVLYEIESPEKVKAGEWVHVSGQIGAKGGLVLRVNGKVVAKGKGSVIANMPADGFAVGADPGSAVTEYGGKIYYEGLMAGLRVYWGAVTEKELGAMLK